MDQTQCGESAIRGSDGKLPPKEWKRGAIFLSPPRDLFRIPARDPRLAPWAVFFRRFAAWHVQAENHSCEKQPPAKGVRGCWDDHLYFYFYFRHDHCTSQFSTSHFKRLLLSVQQIAMLITLQRLHFNFCFLVRNASVIFRHDQER